LTEYMPFEIRRSKFESAAPQRSPIKLPIFKIPLLLLSQSENLLQLQLQTLSRPTL
jgi:hypothetical protein